MTPHERDPLAPARGILIALVLGLATWAVGVLLVGAILRLVAQ